MKWINTLFNTLTIVLIWSLEKYRWSTDIYWQILKSFGKSDELNKLTLNLDKTKFMVVCKGILRNNTINIKLNTIKCTITQSKKWKFWVYIFYTRDDQKWDN